MTRSMLPAATTAPEEEDKALIRYLLVILDWNLWLLPATIAAMVRGAKLRLNAIAAVMHGKMTNVMNMWSTVRTIYLEEYRKFTL